MKSVTQMINCIFFSWSLVINWFKLSIEMSLQQKKGVFISLSRFFSICSIVKRWHSTTASSWYLQWWPWRWTSHIKWETDDQCHVIHAVELYCWCGEFKRAFDEYNMNIISLFDLSNHQISFSGHIMLRPYIDTVNFLSFLKNIH